MSAADSLRRLRDGLKPRPRSTTYRNGPLESLRSLQRAARIRTGPIGKPVTRPMSSAPKVSVKPFDGTANPQQDNPVTDTPPQP